MPAPSERDGADWRRRLSELGRGGRRAHPPLFAPIIFTAAAEIEAIGATDFALDATKIVKDVSDLARMLGLKVAFTGVPCGMLAEALGARLDLSAWPPKVAEPPAGDVTETDDFADAWQRSALLSASMEATRRLSFGSKGPIAVVAIEGPALLCRQIFPHEGLSERTSDFSGRVIAALVTEMAQRGASALVLVDDQMDGTGFRTGALRTVGNVARFHKIPLFSICLRRERASVDEPPTVVPCFAPNIDPPEGRLFGTALSERLEGWSEMPAEKAGCFVTTAAEMVAETSVEKLGRAIPTFLRQLPQ